MRARSKWFIVHRWLGIGLGVWFALVGLTGAILVFEDPIDAWLNPHLLTSSSRGTHLSAQAIVDRAETVFPLGLVEKIRFPATAHQVYRLTLRVKPRRVGVERIEAMFDPAAGTYLGARSLESLGVNRPDAMRTLKSKLNMPEQSFGGGAPPEFTSAVRLSGTLTHNVPPWKGVEAWPAML